VMFPSSSMSSTSYENVGTGKSVGHLLTLPGVIAWGKIIVSSDT